MENAQENESCELKVECPTNNPPSSEGRQPPTSVSLPRNGTDEDCVTIGRKQKAKAAGSNQETVATLDETVVTEELDVDRRHQKVFFDFRAKLIRKISRENGGVRITFPRAGSDSNKVVLHGAKQNVNSAKLAILEVVTDQEAQVVIECDIPRKHHRRVLGPKRANVRALSHEYGVFIKIRNRAVKRAEDAGIGGGYNNEASASATKDATDRRSVFSIRGKENNCLGAKEALLELVPRVITVNVPFWMHRAIVGKRGRRVRSLCNKYLVTIEIPHPKLEKDCVYVRGPARNCEKAQEALIERALELVEEVDVLAMVIDYLALFHRIFYND